MWPAERRDPPAHKGRRFDCRAHRNTITALGEARKQQQRRIRVPAPQRRKALAALVFEPAGIVGMQVAMPHDGNL